MMPEDVWFTAAPCRGRDGRCLDLEVTCICGDKFFPFGSHRSSREFRISGTLASNVLLKLGIDGEVLARSAPFETLHKKRFIVK
jgi:hypothetical protein